MTDAVLVLCTAGTSEEAATIARVLVEERLAACVQISAIESWYRWQGAIEHAPEQRLHIKTAADLAPQVEARIKALHSYDLPEIVTIPIGVRPTISPGSGRASGSYFPINATNIASTRGTSTA